MGFQEVLAGDGTHLALAPKGRGMNYFAHGVAFLDRPYVLAGTAVPDWLLVVDRRVRFRSRQVSDWLNRRRQSETDQDGPIGQVAQGILQHLADDARFHRSGTFWELSGQLSQQVAAVCYDAKTDTSAGPTSFHPVGQSFRRSPPFDGFSASFAGHLLVEVLLDAALIAQCPARLEEFYRVLDQVDAVRVQEAVNRISSGSTERLAPMIREFCRLRILWDYLEDRKLLDRLNQVMRRVGLAELPPALLDLLPIARQQVAARTHQLLDGIPTHCPFGQTKS